MRHFKNIDEAEREEALSHEIVRHRITRKVLQNDRIFWHCVSCGMEGSYSEVKQWDTSKP